ncbi:MAG: DUF2183 domain-containing protein [Archangiaceae bacterium]|nr:DUF2183 domain-containing protein [Archangiaceae bacterium]
MSSSRAESIRALLEGHCDRAEEAQILALLSEAGATELDEVLTGIDVHRLFTGVDDRLAGPDHRSALRALLCDTRLSELRVPSRAAVCRALQKGRTDDADEQAVVRVLLETRGRELTSLKNALNEAGDHRDLQKLVWVDIDDAQRRHTLLAHFAREAVPAGEVKVLSDIDDTLYENWKDTRYPPKTVYPGVVQFYAELDRGADEAGRPGDLTFVSARPTDPVGVIEALTFRTLRANGIRVAAVLTGSVLAARSNEAIAQKKLENFLQYQALYPEYGFVFVGDSGQGDVLFGQAIRQRAPEAVKAVFINDVVATPADRRAALAEQGVYLFDTYVGAAARAHRLGLISRAGLVRVGKAAEEAMRAVPFTDEAQRRDRRDELVRDLELARG